MIAALTIVFREMLEMAMIVGILMAATHQVTASRRWIASGASLGLTGAILLAWFMEEMETAFDGTGEFIFNAVVLSLASILLSWTVLWMSKQGRMMAQQMRQAGQNFSSGSISGMALLLITFSAVVREGSEAVFFLFGAWQLGDQDSNSMIIGGLLGIALGLGCGYLLYKGLLKIPIQHIFQVIAWLLMLVAAGMASQACWNLVTIEWLPPLIDPLWNSSSILSQESWMGELLHVLMGYDDRPSGLQVMVFVTTLASILWLKEAGNKSSARPSSKTSKQYS